MAKSSPIDSLRWSEEPLTVSHLISQCGSQLPVIALVKSIGPQMRSPFRLTDNVILSVDQILRIESVTPAQRRLLVEVAPHHLRLSLPTESPVKFDVPQRKKKNVKLKKIISPSSKYDLPLSVEVNSKNSEYFEKVGALVANGPSRRMPIKMQLSLVRNERFLRINFINKGALTPQVTFLSEALPVQLVIAVGCLGEDQSTEGTQAMWEEMRKLYQLTPATNRPPTTNKKKKKSAMERMPLNVPGIYVVSEGKFNNNSEPDREVVVSGPTIFGEAVSLSSAEIEWSPEVNRQPTVSTTVNRNGEPKDTPHNSKDQSVDGVEPAGASPLERTSSETITAPETEAKRDVQNEGQQPSLSLSKLSTSSSFAARDRSDETTGGATGHDDPLRKSEEDGSDMSGASDREVLSFGAADGRRSSNSRKQALEPRTETDSRWIDRQWSENSTTISTTETLELRETSNGMVRTSSQKAPQNGKRIAADVEIDSSTGELASSLEDRRGLSGDVKGKTSGRAQQRFDEDLVSQSSHRGNEIQEFDQIIRAEKERNSSERRIPQHEADIPPELMKPIPLPRQNLRNPEAVDENENSLVTEMSLGCTGIFRVELMPQLTNGDHSNALRMIREVDSDNEEPISFNGKSKKFNNYDDPHVEISRRSDEVDARATFDALDRRQTVLPMRKEQSEEMFSDNQKQDRFKMRQNTDRYEITDKQRLLENQNGRKPQMMSDTTSPPHRKLQDEDRLVDLQSNAGKARYPKSSTGDASTQTVPESGLGTETDDSVQFERTLSPNGSASKTVIHLRSPSHSSPLTSPTIRRDDSIIKRIIINDGRTDALCKITSIRPFEGDRPAMATAPTMINRVASVREAPTTALPSTSRTLPRQVVRPLEPPVQSPTKISQQVIHLDLSPYSTDSFLTIRRTQDAVEHRSVEKTRKHSAIYHVSNIDHQLQPGTVGGKESWSHEAGGRPQHPSFSTPNLSTAPPANGMVQHFPERNHRKNRDVKTLAAIDRSRGNRQSTEGPSKALNSDQRNETVYRSPNQARQKPGYHGRTGDVTITIHDNRDYNTRGGDGWIEGSRLETRTVPRKVQGNGAMIRRSVSATKNSDTLMDANANGARVPDQIRRSRTLELSHGSRMNGKVVEQPHKSNAVMTESHSDIRYNGNFRAEKFSPPYYTRPVISERSPPLIQARSSQIVEKSTNQTVLRERRSQERSPRQNLSHRSPTSPKERENVKEKRPLIEQQHSRTIMQQKSNTTTVGNSAIDNSFYFNFDLGQPETRPPVTDHVNGYSGSNGNGNRTNQLQSPLESGLKFQARDPRITEAATKRTTSKAAIRSNSHQNDHLLGNKRTTALGALLSGKDKSHQNSRHRTNDQNRRNIPDIARITKTLSADNNRKDVLTEEFGHRTSEKRSNHRKETGQSGGERVDSSRNPLQTKPDLSSREWNAEDQPQSRTYHVRNTDTNHVHTNGRLDVPRSGTARPSGGVFLSTGEGRSPQVVRARPKKSREIAADSELIYPVDKTVRETIRNLDSFLKEQDPDAQSIASSQFPMEHHELMVVRQDRSELSNF